jgi:hypothetical protein
MHCDKKIKTSYEMRYYMQEEASLNIQVLKEKFTRVDGKQLPNFRKIVMPSSSGSSSPGSTT